MVAWELSERNDLELVLNTLKQLEKKPFSKNAPLHLDQGFQYTTKSYENHRNSKFKEAIPEEEIATIMRVSKAFSPI